MDKILINDLKLETVIGVFGWERGTTQILSLDLALAQDLSKAGRSDDVADTIDYGEVARVIVELAGASTFQLVESLAEAIAVRVLERFDVQAVELRLTKRVKVKEAGAFSAVVAIERRRQGE